MSIQENKVETYGNRGAQAGAHIYIIMIHVTSVQIVCTSSPGLTATPQHPEEATEIKWTHTHGMHEPSGNVRLKPGECPHTVQRNHRGATILVGGAR